MDCRNCINLYVAYGWIKNSRKRKLKQNQEEKDEVEEVIANIRTNTINNY